MGVASKPDEEKGDAERRHKRGYRPFDNIPLDGDPTAFDRVHSPVTSISAALNLDGEFMVALFPSSLIGIKTTQTAFTYPLPSPAPVSKAASISIVHVVSYTLAMVPYYGDVMVIRRFVLTGLLSFTRFVFDS